MTVDRADDPPEPVVIPYPEGAGDVVWFCAQVVRDYYLTAWAADPDYADHLADGLHDLMFSPPRGDERTARPGLDLGATMSALRRAIRQPTGAPPPVLQSVPRSD